MSLSSGWVLASRIKATRNFFYGNRASSAQPQMTLPPRKKQKKTYRTVRESLGQNGDLHARAIAMGEMRLDSLVKRDPTVSVNLLTPSPLGSRAKGAEVTCLGEGGYNDKQGKRFLRRYFAEAKKTAGHPSAELSTSDRITGCPA